MPVPVYDIKGKREERRRLYEEMVAISKRAADEKRALSADEQTRWDALDADIEARAAEIKRLERELDLAQDLDRAADANPAHAQQRAAAAAAEPASQDAADPATRAAPGANDPVRRAFDAWLRRGADIEPEQRALLAERRATLSAEERAQTTATGAGGGYTIPTGMMQKVEKALLAYGGIRAASVDLIRTETGVEIPYPTSNDTGNAGRRIGENQQVTTTSVTFASKNLRAYTYTSDVVQVPFQLLEDTAIDLEGFIVDAMSERLARIMNTEDTTGTGDNQPEGVVVGATLGKTTASATAVTYVEILDLIHSVDPAYRGEVGARPADGLGTAGLQAEFMFNDSTLKALKQLLDGQSRPLWMPGTAVREPDTINGYRYVINTAMASMATTAKFMLFGRFRNFKVRDVRGMRMLRLTERYADYGQVGFIGFWRHDAKLIDPGTHPIKYAQNA